MVTQKDIDESLISYLALSIACNEDSSPTPELMLLLNSKQLLGIISLFGGLNVRFPTYKEFGHSLKLAVYVYYTEVLQEDPREVISKLDFGTLKYRDISNRVKEWKEKMESWNIDVNKLIRGYYGNRNEQ